MDRLGPVRGRAGVDTRAGLDGPNPMAAVGTRAAEPTVSCSSALQDVETVDPSRGGGERAPAPAGSLRRGSSPSSRLPGIAIRALVSQGCRPIGNAYTVTRAEGNVVHELGGRPPHQRLQELVATLPREDRELVGRGLPGGRVTDEYKTEPERGDFLIRGVSGVDPQTGALAVGDRIKVGETIKFHVRDAA